MDLAIKNGLVVSPSGITRTGLGIDKGKIVLLALESYLPEADKTIDAKGKYIIPGFVDGHTHVANQWRIGEKPLDYCFRLESKAAAVGGVTTMGCMMYTWSKVDEFADFIKTYDESAVVDTIFHFMAQSSAHLADLSRCLDFGIISIGELGGYKGAQAIYNATGIGFNEIPITPEKILRALREKQGHSDPNKRSSTLPSWKGLRKSGR